MTNWQENGNPTMDFKKCTKLGGCSSKFRCKVLVKQEKLRCQKVKEISIHWLDLLLVERIPLSLRKSQKFDLGVCTMRGGSQRASWPSYISDSLSAKCLVKVEKFRLNKHSLDQLSAVQCGGCGPNVFRSNRHLIFTYMLIPESSKIIPGQSELWRRLKYKYT